MRETAALLLENTIIGIINRENTRKQAIWVSSGKIGTIKLRANPALGLRVYKQSYQVKIADANALMGMTGITGVSIPNNVVIWNLSDDGTLNASNHIWRIRPVLTNMSFVYIQLNANLNYAMTVQHPDRGKVSIEAFSGQTNQQWHVVNGVIRSVANGAQAIDLNGNHQGNGGSISIWPRTDGVTQSWIMPTAAVMPPPTFIPLPLITTSTQF